MEPPWSAYGGQFKVVESTESVVTCQHLPLERPVEGLFVRQWEECGAGQGQLEYPRELAGLGHEVVVCDRNNHLL